MRTDPHHLAGRTPHPLGRVPRRVWTAGIVLLVAACGWYLTSNYRAVMRYRIAQATALRLDGPPCPRITQSEFLRFRHHRAPRGFDYEGVTFIRRYGQVECGPIYEGGGRSERFHPVCVFSAPGDLLIRTQTDDWYFQPGIGRPATVSVAHGLARCVMTSDFRP